MVTQVVPAVPRSGTLCRKEGVTSGKIAVYVRRVVLDTRPDLNHKNNDSIMHACRLQAKVLVRGTVRRFRLKGLLR